MSKFKIICNWIYGESPTNIPNITKDVDSFITNNQEIYDNLIKKYIYKDYQNK